MGQRIFECVLSIGTRSAQNIMASGFTAAQTGRTHDRTRPMTYVDSNEDDRRPLPAVPTHPASVARQAVPRHYPRWEPGALAAPAGICAGGEEKSSSSARTF